MEFEQDRPLSAAVNMADESHIPSEDESRKKTQRHAVNNHRSAHHTDGDGTSSGASDDEEANLIQNQLTRSQQMLLDSERNNTANQSLMNVIKANIGTGILALPAAFKYGGLWVSFVGVIFMAVIALHCIHLLLRCNAILCRRTGRSQMDYGDVVEMSFHSGPPSLQRFAPASKVVMNAFLLITQLGFCTVYIHFVAENIQKVIEEFFKVSWNIRIFDLVVYLLLIPYVCIRNLRTLSWFSSVANVFMFVGLCITLQYCFFGLPSVSSRPAFGGWDKLPLFFGIAIYAFEGIGVVLPIENKMRNPEDLRGWNGVVNTGLAIVASMYAAVGFFGYLKFGEEIEGTITVNLPSSPWYYVVVKLVFAGAIFFSYGLQFYVPIDILWPIFDNRAETSVPRHYHLWIRSYGEYLLRFILLTFTFILAIAIPQLDLMISLIGALSSSAVAIIIPPLINMVTLHPEGRLTRPMIVKDVAIMIFGFIGFIVGTATTCVQIVNAFKGHTGEL